jgi:MOSC domain-containing protein YiiM
MGVVLESGPVAPGDAIVIEHAPDIHAALAPV